MRAFIVVLLSTLALLFAMHWAMTYPSVEHKSLSHQCPVCGEHFGSFEGRECDCYYDAM